MADRHHQGIGEKLRSHFCAHRPAELWAILVGMAADPPPLNLRRLSVRHGDDAKIRNKLSFTIDADIGGVGLVSIDMHLRY